MTNRSKDPTVRKGSKESETESKKRLKKRGNTSRTSSKGAECNTERMNKLLQGGIKHTNVYKGRTLHLALNVSVIGKKIS